MNTKYDIIIIGGGASGLFASAVASEKKLKVLVIEKNEELGKKLKITGGGRCNITNAEFDFKKFLENFGDSKKFLYSPFSKFSAKDTFNFFESNGLELTEEARKRVFPKSQKALDVFKTLEKILIKNKVEILKNTKVKKLVKKDEKITSVKTSNNKEFFAENFILSTGGLAAPFTGSTGDGFNFLEKLGHKVKKPSPNIVPLKTNCKVFHKISGTSHNNCKVSFIQNEKIAFKKTGRVLFTHFGLSAPMILNSSFEVLELLKHGKVFASFDFFPDLEINILDKKVLKVFNQNLNKKLKNVLPEIIEKKIAFAILESFKKDISEKNINEIKSEERKEILQKLKSFKMEIVGSLGLEKSVIVDGGVVSEEVEFKNMTSKLYPNLYLTGDILNINRPSGGFSLQLCWTTAFVAVDDIVRKKKNL